jgi:hypothetical protein
VHSANKETVDICFEVSKHHMVEIQGVRVRRTCKYPSIKGDAILEIVEVQEVIPSISSVVEGRNSRVIVATTAIEDPNDPFKKTWYEVNISSASANHSFSENSGIEIGEETAWTAEGMVESGVVSSICTPACTIINSGDGLGFYNANGQRGVPNQTPGTNVPSSKPGSGSAAQIGEPAFW